jgi:hypothetical protein
MSNLVLIERMVTRGGRTHPWHYWVRPDEVKAGDRRIKSATALPTADKRAARDAKKLDGTATKAHEAHVGPMSSPDTLTINEPALAAQCQQVAKELGERSGRVELLAGKDGGAFTSLSNKFAAAVNSEKQGFVAKVLSTEVKGWEDTDGIYSPKTGMMALREDHAENLRTALANGKVSSIRQAEAVRVVTHEVLHSASAEHATETAGEFRPHAALEEATTEILAQHYSTDMAKTLGMQDPSGWVGPRRHLFEMGMKPALSPSGPASRPRSWRPGESPELYVDKVRTTAYASFTTAFAEVVAVAEHVDLRDPAATRLPAPEEFDRSVRDWAWTLKCTRGSLRYERLAHRYLERAGADEQDKGFTKLRNAVAEQMKDHMGWSQDEPRPASELVEELGKLVARRRR